MNKQKVVDKLTRSVRVALCFEKKIELFTVFFTLLFLSINAAKVYSQTPQQNQNRSQANSGSPIGSHDISELENINYFNGSLNFTVPIASLNNRGNVLAGDIDLRIQSQWNLLEESNCIVNGNPDICQYLGGVSSGRLTSIDSSPGYSPTSMRYYIGTVHRNYNGSTTFIYQMSSGESVTLYDKLTNGLPTPESTPNLNRERVFESKDGSMITFVSDIDVIDCDNGDCYDFPVVNGYLYFGSGTVARVQGSYIVWSRDRNGNTYGHDSIVSEPLAPIKDNLGREITAIYNYNNDAPQSSNREDRIITKGFNGQNRTTRIIYKKLSDGLLKSGMTIRMLRDLFPTSRYNFRPCLNFPHVPENDCVADPQLIASLILPNNRQYNFKYTSYGYLARVELPSGGAIEYDWDKEFQGANNPMDINYLEQRLVERRTYDENNNLVLRTTYSKPLYYNPQGQILTEGYVEIKEFSSSSSLLSKTRHYYHWSRPGSNYFPQANYSSPDWYYGKEYKTEYFGDNGNTLVKRVESKWEQNNTAWWNTTYGSTYCQANGCDGRINNPRVTETKTTLVETNQVSKVTYNHDEFLNIVDTYEYGYETGQPGNLIRRVHTDYITDTNYTSHTGSHLRGLVSKHWVSSDANGNNKLSSAEYEYDNYVSDNSHAPLLARLDAIGYDHTNYGVNFIRRGNITGIKTYANAGAQTGEIISYAQYDILGNVVKKIDPKGNSSLISYIDNFGTADSEARLNTPPSELGLYQSYAFPTSATNTANWTDYTQFDYFTGKPVETEDINGVINSALANDPFDRITQIISANNLTNARRQTTIAYNDLTRKITTTSDLTNYGDNLIKTERYHDSFGKVLETWSYKADGNYIVSKTEFDGLGRAKKTYNPYNPGLSETLGWTEIKYDSLGRIMEEKTQDGAKILSDYLGSKRTITDQAGRKRSGIADSLGRVIKVIEDPNGQNLTTDYFFDAANNLRKITQGEQSRYFMYDSLNRLLRAKQPEQNASISLSITDPVTQNNQWSSAYSYDNNGNILVTTDARAITITGTYDNLNRLTSRDYSDSTPDVSFTYDDPAIPFSKGKTTHIQNGISETKYTAFDALGQILSSQQMTDGQSYNFNYQYNRSGQLVSETYPSGRVVQNQFNNDGNLAKTLSQKNGAASWKTYISDLTYTSFGAIEKLRLGNGKWETAKFNNRLQATEIGLGHSSTDTSLWKTSYSYGSTNNNGALKSQTITVPTIGSNTGFTAVQSYSYDSLNRLESANEYISEQQTWNQTFVYDRYGNRRFNQATTTTLSPNCPQVQCNPEISSATNRLIGYNFDAAGNLVQDAEGKGFTYDAENKQEEVRDTNNKLIGKYFFDGERRRIKKITNAETVVFVYDALGQLAVEYSTQISQSPTTSYLTSDNLGSPRVTTDAGGIVINRTDYHSFGEKIVTPQRTSPVGYQLTNNVRQGYTGYQEDVESDLEYAQARMYSSRHGRFTSVDPLTASATIKNPQTFNRYSYVLNSPYKFVDPLGLAARLACGQGQGRIGICAPGDEGADGDDQTQKPSNKQQQDEKKKQNRPKYRLSLISATLIPENSDPSAGGRPKGGDFGAKVEVVYEVQDADGNTVKEAGIVPLEQVSGSVIAQGAEPSMFSLNSDKPAELGPREGTKNTGKTDENGRFVDAPVGQYAPVSFSNNATQKLFIRRDGQIYEVGKTNVVVGNNKITLTYTPPKGVKDETKQKIEVKVERNKKSN